jgi:hypothetical protein
MVAVKIIFLFFSGFVYLQSYSQDTTDLLGQVEATDTVIRNSYTSATFKSTRLINGHTVENLGKGVLDFKISHRFGKLNGGAYNLFGLDNATTRFAFDYGITPLLMVGVGRSTFEKTYDAFAKIKILRQTEENNHVPVTVSLASVIAVKTLRSLDTSRKLNFSSRLFYTHQVIIARKFSESTSFQLTPTYSHRNLVRLASEPNNLFALGIGGRQKISRRVSLNAEYYYQLPDYKLSGTTNSLSLGVDIETGGHVFQLHFTNSQGMSERTFINETRADWDKGDIYFGFNISRVFDLGKRHP